MLLFLLGEISLPYAWQPSVVPLQILTVGQLAIIAVPGEFTTMAGRLVREQVKTVSVNGPYYGKFHRFVPNWAPVYNLMH